VRTVLSIAGISLATLLTLAATSSSAPSTPAARSAKDVVQRANLADKVLDELLVRAKTDARLEAVYTYETYGPTEMNDPKRKVVIEKTDKEQAAGLLDMMTDESLSPDVREAAANKIFSDQAIRYDPALNVFRTRNQNSPRAKLSIKIVKLLSNNDALTRSLSNRVLKGLWQGLSDADINAYDPRNDPKGKATWGKAREAWLRYLAKQ